MKDNLEKALEKITHGRWSEIRGNWLAHLPTITPRGSAPELQLDGVPGIETIEREVFDESNVSGTIQREIAGVRALIFWHGVYFLHRASHVTGAAELHAGDGVLTWSLSSSLTI